MKGFPRSSTQFGDPAGLPPRHHAERPVGIQTHLCYPIPLHWLSPSYWFQNMPDIILSGGRQPFMGLRLLTAEDAEIAEIVEKRTCAMLVSDRIMLIL